MARRVQKVRTPAGVAKYNQPIGSIIVADAKLLNLTWVENLADGWSRLRGSNKRYYDIGRDSQTGLWYVTGKNSEKIYVDYAETEAEALTMLDEGIERDRFRRGKILYGSALDFDDSEDEQVVWDNLRRVHDDLRAKFGNRNRTSFDKYTNTHLVEFRKHERNGDYDAAAKAILDAQAAADGIASQRERREAGRRSVEERRKFLAERARRIKESGQTGSLSVTPEAVNQAQRAINDSTRGARVELVVTTGGKGEKRLKIDKIKFSGKYDSNVAREVFEKITAHADLHGWDIIADENSLGMPPARARRLLKAAKFGEFGPRRDAGFQGTHSRKARKYTGKPDEIVTRDGKVIAPEFDPDGWESLGNSDIDEGITGELFGQWASDGLIYGEVVTNGKDFAIWINNRQVARGADLKNPDAGFEKAEAQLKDYFDTYRGPWEKVRAKEYERTSSLREARKVESFYDYFEPVHRTDLTKKQRSLAAREDSRELGISVANYEMKGLYGIPDSVEESEAQNTFMNPWVHERVNAIVATYEEMYPGFAWYNPHWGVFSARQRAIAHKRALFLNDPEHSSAGYLSAIQINRNIAASNFDDDDAQVELNGMASTTAFEGQSWWSTEGVPNLAAEKGYMPSEVMFDTIINHELGHTVHSIIAGYSIANNLSPIGDRRDRYMDAFVDIAGKYGITGRIRGSIDRNKVREWVSDYGTKNMNELAAEVWASYMMDERPSKFVLEFGAEMERQLQEVMDEVERNY